MILDGTTLFFLNSAPQTVGCAAMVVIPRTIVRSVVWLAATFVGASVILYIFLNSEYLFLIQILVYVGAINVLILFGIMLTKRRMVGGDACEEYEESIVKRRRSKMNRGDSTQAIVAKVLVVGLLLGSCCTRVLHRMGRHAEAPVLKTAEYRNGHIHRLRSGRTELGLLLFSVIIGRSVSSLRRRMYE